ncbi:uncharacterized protein [Drosophila bipectinata]|uniref:uncharacterized protein n=1 Tax=Drosophila bipectinata TaxID=42026 RepID=UPI001C8ACFBD|nr:uncharacterized protein LOC108133395 [Drosophila bipectinata]
MRPSHHLFAVFLGLVVGWASAGSIVPSPLADTTDDNPCQNVRLAGFVCLDCNTLGYCIHDTTNQWQTVSMLECQTGHSFYCSDEGTFGCTWQSQCTVPQRGPFSCQQPGLFPDPYDCRKYHECSALSVDTPRQCTNGAGYSTLTGDCVLPRESDQCTSPQYSCTKSGQIGAWPADNRFYYICMGDAATSFYPLLLKCDDGFIFQNSGCVANTRNLALRPKEAPKCIGNYNYECSTGDAWGSTYCKCVDGELQTKSCPTGYHFDPKILACRTGLDSFDCRDFEVMPCPNNPANDEYCLCMSSQLEVRSCPEGEVFNEYSLLCMSVDEDEEIRLAQEALRIANL